MRCLVATVAIAALALTSCTVPTYDLDAIVIHGQPEVVDILSAAVTRLGGTATQAGHAVDTDSQQAYCLVLADYSTLAITAMRRRSLWHELGGL